MKTLSQLNLSPLVAVVDIETAATTVNAQILSVGCVIVNVLDQVEVARFYSRCDYLSQFRDSDEQTLAWWEKVKETNHIAYNEAFCNKLVRSPLQMVLTGLNAFLATHFGDNKMQVMGNGPEFDNAILIDAFTNSGINPAWHFRGNQNLRTAVLMGRLLLGIDPKYDLPANPHPHHALYDALHEANYLMAIFAAFKQQLQNNEVMCAYSIQPVEVQREFGFFTHPSLPNWGESVSSAVLDKWFAKNHISFSSVMFEDDAPVEYVERWFEEGSCDCSEWEPTKPYANSFLLSIHDTEDGPVAWFATPLEVM